MTTPTTQTTPTRKPAKTIWSVIEHTEYVGGTNGVEATMFATEKGARRHVVECIKERLVDPYGDGGSDDPDLLKEAMEIARSAPWAEVAELVEEATNCDWWLRLSQDEVRR